MVPVFPAVTKDGTVELWYYFKLVYVNVLFKVTTNEPVIFYKSVDKV